MAGQHVRVSTSAITPPLGCLPRTPCSHSYQRALAIPHSVLLEHGPTCGTSELSLSSSMHWPHDTNALLRLNLLGPPRGTLEPHPRHPHTPAVLVTSVVSDWAEIQSARDYKEIRLPRELLYELSVHLCLLVSSRVPHPLPARACAKA